MKNFTLLIVFAFISNFSFAQSLTISEESSTINNGVNEYSVSGYTVGISNGTLSFAGQAASSAINSLTAISAVLENEGVFVHAGNGDELFNTSFDLEAGDTSAKVYAKLNGAFVIRENIANFLFYDSKGQIRQSVSNSSQSTEGESISELAADPAFKTVVLYNPKIISGGSEGSRVRIINPNYTTDAIYNSNERAIRLVKVSDNGQFIGIITYGPDSDDKVVIKDRFGNDLVEISFDQSIEDFVISADGNYVTIRSNGRVGVYSILSGERIGSTSFRSRLFYAEYVPEDKTIIALTADQSGSVLSETEVHAINVDMRAIQRQSYNSRLSITDLLPLELTRNGSFNYTLSGLNRSLDLNVQF